jgi:hypothetical protein
MKTGAIVGGHEKKPERAGWLFRTSKKIEMVPKAGLLK